MKIKFTIISTVSLLEFIAKLLLTKKKRKEVFSHGEKGRNDAVIIENFKNILSHQASRKRMAKQLSRTNVLHMN